MNLICFSSSVKIFTSTGNFHTFVWGGGALLIRYVVRKCQLGWKNMLFLALVLSVAEEFLIQQTSIAPPVIHLKGVTYARALGINYVYLLWALIYESVSAVILPIYLTELIFPERKKDLLIILLMIRLGLKIRRESATKISHSKTRIESISQDNKISAKES